MKECYAFKYEDDQVLENSSSGGAFSALSDYILKCKGVVYGAVYDFETNTVMHKRAETKEERNCMRGSKYIQSKMNNIYCLVADDLLHKKIVLFTGTICQIEGLKKYINLKGIDSQNLFTVDIICHGTGSPKIWKEYIESVCKNKLSSINFRYKKNGWEDTSAVATSDGITYDLSEYMKLFYGHVIMRPVCHYCPFTSTDRISEITIGDFWGIDAIDVRVDYRKGISFLMTNNEKGKFFLEEVKKANNRVFTSKVEITDVRQPNLYSPTKMSVIRTRFWSDYKKKGINYTRKKYASKNIFFNYLVLAQKVLDSLF